MKMSADCLNILYLYNETVIVKKKESKDSFCTDTEQCQKCPVMRKRQVEEKCVLYTFFYEKISKRIFKNQVTLQ